MLSAAADRIPHGAIIMSDPTSTHKVAAVTRGMGGIGQGIVIALPQRDFYVAVCDRTIDPAIAERMTTNAAPGAHLSFVNLLEEGFIPINRWGTPEDVGHAVPTMAAGELPFTTGAAIQVDSGMHIHQY
jgi:NAD(P)-dependent dehydrogenase (short-subunit alcohol dehydrogenase family)